VFFQGVSSLVLSIDYFFTEKYYLIPVLAILLPIVFTPLKNGMVHYVDNIHKFEAFFFRFQNLIIKYLAFCTNNVFGNHT